MEELDNQLFQIEHYYFPSKINETWLFLK